MDDNVIKQLIKQKQIYETPDGEKFDTELAAIMHIKAKLQSTHQKNDGTYKRIFGLSHELWAIPPVTINHVSISQNNVK